MRGIANHAVYGRYKAEGLSSLSRLIHDDEPFTLTKDKDRVIHVPVELNKQIIKEESMIAEEKKRIVRIRSGCGHFFLFGEWTV